MNHVAVVKEQLSARAALEAAAGGDGGGVGPRPNGEAAAQGGGALRLGQLPTASSHLAAEESQASARATRRLASSAARPHTSKVLGSAATAN